MNPNVQVDLYDDFFTSANARRISEPYDIIIDGTDNFPTRYCSNDIAVFLKKPNIYGSIFRFDGQCTVFAPHLGGPCYRCMFPEPPPARHGPRAVRKVASSACSPASSASCKPSKPSSSSWASASRSSAA
ncbi:MAG: ThiF family adenylyltransferase [Chthoniobacter sp.]